MTMLIAIGILGETVQGYQMAAMAVITLSMYGLLLAGKRSTPAAGEH